MKKKMTILGGLLLAVVVTGYSVSGTYAKYIDTNSISDSATVVAFTASEDVTMNLFGGDEIQPGSHGSYTLTFGVAGETGFNYSLAVDETVGTGSVNTVTTTDYNPLRFALTPAADAATATFATKTWMTYEDLVNELNGLSITAGDEYVLDFYWFYDAADIRTKWNLAEDAELPTGIVSNNTLDTEIGTNADGKVVRLVLNVTKEQAAN